jgi:nicotinamidase-related amidase
MSALLVGQPVLISIDHQQAGFNPNYPIPHMDGYDGQVRRAAAVLAAARETGIPVVFIQERHSRTYVDFGRELDGSEGVHCVEDDPDTELVTSLRPQPDEYFVPKRRYSAFFGTDLEILLRGLRAETLVLCGALTDVCVHYTFVDAHQRDYRVRVLHDVVSGSSPEAHDAALRAMAYLQADSLTTSDAMIDCFYRYQGPRRPAVQRPPVPSRS